MFVDGSVSIMYPSSIYIPCLSLFVKKDRLDRFFCPVWKKVELLSKVISQESNRTGYVKIEEVCEYIYCVMCAPLHAGLEEGNPIYIYILS